MPFAKIYKNIHLGDQFSKNKKTFELELKISNIYYKIFLKNNDKTCFNDYFVKTNDKVCINLFDSHDANDFSDKHFIPALKFLTENVDKQIYTHCQLGVSRSASVIFMFLVINNLLPNDNFKLALRKYVEDFYPYMKVNLGIYQYLKQNFPFSNLKVSISRDWEDIAND